MDADDNCTNASQQDPDIARGASLTVIWVLAIFGNLLTLVIVLRYRLRKVPDLLVFGLACTDLVACAFPIPTSLWSYYTGRQIDCVEHLVRLCSAYTVLAKFTRDSSIFVVTLMVVDRCVWVLRPIQYNQGVYHKFFCVSLPAAWLLALFVSLLSLAPKVETVAGGNVCLFSFQNWYGILVIVYGLFQFIVVLVCFVIVLVEVLKLARRRRKMTIKGAKGTNQSLSCNTLTKLEAVTVHPEKVENGQHTSQSALSVESNAHHLSCLKWMKKQLKCVREKVRPSAEQQFAIMFSAIIILFYVSWLPIVSLILYANIADTDDPNGNGEALFWAIRFTVISAAINPFLYGILGGRYRRVYKYYLRMLFSKCCRCVQAPSSNPFIHTERTSS